VKCYALSTAQLVTSGAAELKALVEGIRAVKAARGSGEKQPAAVELEIAAVERKSLVAAHDISVGPEDLIALRQPDMKGLAEGAVHALDA